MKDAYAREKAHLQMAAIVEQQTTPDIGEERTQQYRADTNNEMTRIEQHLDYNDRRLNDVSDQVAGIKGIGAGAIGVLGVLQILNLIAAGKKPQ